MITYLTIKFHVAMHVSLQNRSQKTYKMIAFRKLHKATKCHN